LALCEIIGVVGVKYMAEQVNTLIYENILKIKKIVIQNKDILQSLRTNFDRPEMMRELCKRLESIKIHGLARRLTNYISFGFRR
jgi:NCK-associated protein 1